MPRENQAQSRVSGSCSKVTLWPRSSIRWWGAALGAAIAIGDAFTLRWLGVNLTSHGSDVTLFVAGWFGLSFALLGFLLGKATEDRRRAQTAADIIRVQMRELEASREQLMQSEKLAALGTLAAAIAHEVRNPLAVIRSAAQTLSDSAPDTDEAHRACRFVIEEADRLTALVDSMLAFARPVRVMAQPITVAELFDRALILAHAEIETRKVRLERDDSIDGAIARADPNLMAQVLAGLLINAAQAVPIGGRVRIESLTGSSTVEMAIEDSGPGVAPELRGRIFEPFFTTRASGVGLGLAIARQITQAHGGSIRLDDSYSGGARFSVVLPRSSLT